MSFISNGRSRALLAIACLFFLIIYHFRTNQLEDLAQKISRDLISCKEQTDSIIARLQLMYEHKELASELLNRERRDIQLNREQSETRIRNSLLEINRLQKDLSICQLNSQKASTQPREQADLLLQKEKEMIQMKENLNQLQHVFEGKLVEIEALRRENEELKKSENECRDKLSIQAAGHPRDPTYYVQNETVHFARQHKADQGLEFNRDSIHFEPAKILPVKDLIENLKEKREKEVNVHPDQRVLQDDYVAEKQDLNEKDYKEH